MLIKFSKENHSNKGSSPKLIFFIYFGGFKHVRMVTI